jgi:hypothetical protein
MESEYSQEIECRLSRLKEFKKELLIFPFTEKMISKFDLDVSEETHFFKTLINIYA